MVCTLIECMHVHAVCQRCLCQKMSTYSTRLTCTV